MRLVALACYMISLTCFHYNIFESDSTFIVPIFWYENMLSLVIITFLSIKKYITKVMDEGLVSIWRYFWKMKLGNGLSHVIRDISFYLICTIGMQDCSHSFDLNSSLFLNKNYILTNILKLNCQCNKKHEMNSFWSSRQTKQGAQVILISFSMGLVWLLQEYLEFNISNIWWAWGINDRNWYCSFLRSHVMNCETSQQYLFQTQILLCLQDTLHKVNRDQCFCLQLICFVQLKLVE